MIQDILKSVSREDSNTLETDTLAIKDNAIIVKNSSIQITSISMVSRSNFSSPITLLDYVILFVLFIIGLIPPFIGLIFLVGYAYLVYKKHKQHLNSKYYIIFNLGSSRDYFLYFKDSNFRDKVFDVITKSFNNKNQNIKIDIKNQNIKGDNYESGSSRNDVSGSGNIVGTNIDNGSQVSLSGDISNGSTIIKDSNINNADIHKSVEIPWTDMVEQLNLIINTQLSTADKAIYSELLEISEAKDERKLKNFVNKMSSFFKNDYVQNTITGVLGNVISSILMK